MVAHIFSGEKRRSRREGKGYDLDVYHKQLRFPGKGSQAVGVLPTFRGNPSGMEKKKSSRKLPKPEVCSVHIEGMTTDYSGQTALGRSQKNAGRNSKRCTQKIKTATLNKRGKR